MDPWRVTSEERLKHEEQFRQLQPVGGFVTGEQAKGFFLQSHLPPIILGQIWGLADINADGKMDCNEFSIAMKLIQMKLKGFDIPKVLPPSLKMLVTMPSTATMPSASVMGIPPPTSAASRTSMVAGGMAGVRPIGTGMAVHPSHPIGVLPTAFPPTQYRTPPPQTIANFPSVLGQGVIGGNIIPPSAVLGPVTMGGSFGRSASPVDGKTQRSGSIASQESPTGSIGSPLQEWAVSHPSKLKYTQMFNTQDRTRTGFLSGPQARNILVQSGLPQNILAQIWALSDIDNDGKLTCEEFCLAMHLVESVKAGDRLPTGLPPELIPPSYRRVRSSSIQGNTGPQGMTGGSALINDIMGFAELDDDDKRKPMLATFEDKRRENFEKGQAELEKRRQALLESQRKEQEERERKDREEQERKERIRQEHERRRQMELEKQLAKQRELEQEKEEQRRKAMEQREAARREMERQRQLELEKQRRQELMTQRQKEQERVLQLKARNQSLTIELEQLNEKIKDLNSKLSDARNGVNDLKGLIDQMRATRDRKFTELESLKNDIKNQNQKLLLVNQEKTLLQSQLKNNMTGNPTVESFNIVMHSFNNKHITLNQLKDKLSNLEQETKEKLQDIDNNNLQLQDLKNKIGVLVKDGENLYSIYLSKRDEVLAIRKQSGISHVPSIQTENNTWANDSWNEIAKTEVSVTSVQDAWATNDNWPPKEESSSAEWATNDANAWNATTTQNAWDSSNQQEPSAAWNEQQMDDTWDNNAANEQGVWGVQGSETSQEPEESQVSEAVKYRTLYAFEARNPDELSIEPGDIIVVPDGMTPEPGWLGGHLRGKTGWFPEAYVELITGENETITNSEVEVEEQATLANNVGLQETVHIVGTEMKMTLTGIQEAPENISDNGSATDVMSMPDSQASAFMHVLKSSEVETASHSGKEAASEGLLAQALFPWRAKKENHLTFNKNDVITVKEQQDMWWYGETDVGKAGWFPKSYVKLIAGPRRPGQEQQEEGVNGEPEPTEEVVTPVTEYFEALYSYQSSETGDLSFTQGDAIMVTKKDGDWWTGICGNRVGVFPSNYVKKAEKQIKHGKKPEIAVVIAPYSATGPEQLSLQRGQLIHIRKKSQNGWWEGELQAKGKKRQIGWFPASYVKQLTSSARNTPEPGGEQVVSMYPYEAQNEDELTFQKGATITLVSKDDGAWWKGECNGAIGLFPANYVQPMDLQTAGTQEDATMQWLKKMLSLPPQERKRQESIMELINTEQSYVDDMSIVLDAFCHPLAKVCTDAELESIFVNWTEISACNSKFLKALRVRKKRSTNGIICTIGDILCENIPHMTSYIRFCSRQLNAATLIQKKTENNPEFKDIARKCCRDPRTKGMPLSSFLLKPMQRITKYPLLIKKIIQYTSETHPDLSYLKDALSRSEELCSQVNEGVREKENSDRLEWVQQHVQCDGIIEKITFNSLTNSLGPRKVLHSGILIKVKSNKELNAFLFNDFLLLTQTPKVVGSMSATIHFDKNSNIRLKLYKQPLFMNEVMIKPQDNEDELQFQISHIDRTYNVRALNINEKNTWIKKLAEASRNYIETDRKKREKAHSLRVQRTAGVGRLLVVVIEGLGLKAKSDGRSDPYCEVRMGSQEHRTKIIADTVNPKWNASMQFIIKDVYQDVLCITVFDRDYFSPNDFLGRTEIRVSDILQESQHTKEPIIKKLLLYEVETGEILVKLDLQLFDMV